MFTSVAIILFVFTVNTREVNESIVHVGYHSITARVHEGHNELHGLSTAWVHEGHSEQLHSTVWVHWGHRKTQFTQGTTGINTVGSCDSHDM